MSVLQEKPPGPNEKVWTAEEIREAQAAAAVRAAEMERERRAADRLVGIASAPNGLYVLTLEGRLFFRVLDDRASMNRPGQLVYKWIEVEGPLT